MESENETKTTSVVSFFVGYKYTYTNYIDCADPSFRCVLQFLWDKSTQLNKALYVRCKGIGSGAAGEAMASPLLSLEHRTHAQYMSPTSFLMKHAKWCIHSSQPSRSGRETPDEEDLIPLPPDRELQQRNLPTVPPSPDAQKSESL